MTNEEKQKLLKPGERLDDLQIGGLELIQDPDGFCFGVDAVFLSDFAKVRAGETVLDLGTGNGIIRSCFVQRRKERNLPAWRSRRTQPKWQGAVWP